MKRIQNVSEHVCKFVIGLLGAQIRYTSNTFVDDCKTYSNDVLMISTRNPVILKQAQQPPKIRMTSAYQKYGFDNRRGVLKVLQKISLILPEGRGLAIFLFRRRQESLSVIRSCFWRCVSGMLREGDIDFD